MHQSFNELQYIIGNNDTVEEMTKLPMLQPFNDTVISFFNDLSSKLRVNREFPDVATFGFWCRKAALVKEKSHYDDCDERLGKGIVFHSTPSNVPVNFAFSFAAGLLAGNANIVRLPGKQFAQVDIICNAIKQLISDSYSELAPYICFVKFSPNKQITDYFSGICDTRVIWGGDATIKELRMSPLQPRANEITFADRHSIAIIDADAYLACDNTDNLIQNFYNDTYYTDQNACTSPRIIFWKGTHKREAKENFWNRVHDMVRAKYEMAPVQSVGKLSAFYRVAAAKDVKLEDGEDMLVTRIKVTSIDSSLLDYKYNSGFFYEYDIDSLQEIIPICTDRCQTLSYFGLNSDLLKELFALSKPHGIDRVVPIGKTMDFSLIWDGYDLIRSMSRKFYIL